MLTLLLTLAVSTQPKKVPPEQYGWLTDYPTARAQAAKSGKPLLLVFRCDP